MLFIKVKIASAAVPPSKAIDKEVDSYTDTQEMFKVLWLSLIYLAIAIW